MASESVHCVVTSPPYWGLRDYGTGTWEGGEAGCDHVAGQRGGPVSSGSLGIEKGTASHEAAVAHGESLRTVQYRTLCRKCGARRIDRQLGLEPTPEAHVEKMVDVFREVRRVLRKDGTLWLNYGDSYASGCGEVGRNDAGTGIREGRKQPCAEDRKDRRVKVSHGLKPKDLVGMPWRVAFALQADGWYLRSDIIWAKCLSGGTRVYAKTQKGEMPTTIKDLVRLDPATVKLWDGAKWNQCVDWIKTPGPTGPVELVLRNGERIGCTLEHRWPTRRGLVPTHELKVGDVLDRRELPEPGGADEPEYLPDEIGWLAGLYIAEGSRGKGGKVLQFAQHAEEIERFEKVRRIAERYGGSCRLHKTNGNAATCNVYGPVVIGLIDNFVSGRTAHDKHLHPRCWSRSNTFLRSVLDGYLCGDGHRRNDTAEWRLGFCKNDNLASDLRTLCARVGLSVRLKRTHHTFDGRRYPGWRGSIREPHSRRSDDTEIVEIGASRARKFWDIRLAEEPHTFALASGTLTHNSNPMPESVTDRPTKSHEYIFLLTRSSKYFFDQEAVREKATGFISRPSFRGGCYVNNKPGNSTDVGNAPSESSGRNIRTVWNIATQPFPQAHFATFPEEIPYRCIKAGTSLKGCCPECGAPWGRVVERVGGPPRGNHRDRGDFDENCKTAHRTGTVAGSALSKIYAKYGYAKNKTTGWIPGCRCESKRTPPDWPPPTPCTVLDPFMGSGTTLLVAQRLSRNGIGIELNPEYAEMARKRVTEDQPLFSEVTP